MSNEITIDDVDLLMTNPSFVRKLKDANVIPYECDHEKLGTKEKSKILEYVRIHGVDEETARSSTGKRIDWKLNRSQSVPTAHFDPLSVSQAQGIFIIS